MKVVFYCQSLSQNSREQLGSGPFGSDPVITHNLRKYCINDLNECIGQNKRKMSRTISTYFANSYKRKGDQY